MKSLILLFGVVFALMSIAYSAPHEVERDQDEEPEPQGDLAKAQRYYQDLAKAQRYYQDLAKAQAWVG